MDVLLIGSEGYLGCVTWKALKSRGHRVQGLDRGLYGVRNHDDDRCFDHPHAVINLAGLVGERVCQDNPEMAEQVNVEYAEKQAKKAAADGAEVFVHVSTTRVYGAREPGEVVDMKSGMPSVDTLPVYASMKYRAEHKVLDIDAKKTRVHVLRLADMLGPSPRMRFDQTANELALMAGRNRKIVVRTPEHVRAYVSVRACANAICWLIESGADASQLLNFAGKSRTIMQLARVCADALPVRARVDVDSVCSVIDNLNYAVECSDELKHIEDGVEPSLAYMTKEIYHYRWAGARADDPEWGNVGWRW